MIVCKMIAKPFLVHENGRYGVWYAVVNMKSSLKRAVFEDEGG